MNILHALGSVIAGIIAAPVMLLVGLFGNHTIAPQPDVQSQAPLYGQTIPVTTSFYSDSLQAGVTKTATSMTLVSGKDSQGVSLSGTYGFVLDQGTASQEIVLCTSAVGVTVTGCTRGIDLTTGTTSVAALEQVHNRGASVQITTAPVVNIMANIFRGMESIPSLLFYNQNFTFSSSTQLASKGYVDGVALAGSPNADNSTKGVVQMATAAQASSGTSLGSTGARLGLGADIATSTCQVAANSVLVSSSTTGKLGGNCLDGTYGYTWSGTNTHTATTTWSNANVGIGTTSPYAALSVVSSAPAVFGTIFATSTATNNATSTFSGNVQVVGNATTTNLTISNSCTGCTNPTIVSAGVGSLNGGTPATATVTVSCSGTQKVSGGGVNTNGYSQTMTVQNSSYPSSPTAWTVVLSGPNGSTVATGATAYAICINP